jgi:hypothetical protein
MRLNTAIHSATAAMLACAVSTAPLGAGERRNLEREAAENQVKLSGCLVRGEGDGAGYLLTNAPAEPAWLNPSAGRVAPNAVGTTGGFTTVFYWLDGRGDLKEHIGHRVEIEGDLKGNLKEGEITVERKDQWTEVSVKADGRTMKYNVPHTSVVADPDRDKTQKGDILVRRVEVEKVKMVGASCAP